MPKNTPNKLLYKGHTYRRAHSAPQEAVMWKEFGALVKRLADTANSDKISSYEKQQIGIDLWEKIRFYAQQIGIR